MTKQLVFPIESISPGSLASIKGARERQDGTMRNHVAPEVTAMGVAFVILRALVSRVAEGFVDCGFIAGTEVLWFWGYGGAEGIGWSIGGISIRLHDIGVDRLVGIVSEKVGGMVCSMTKIVAKIYLSMGRINCGGLNTDVFIHRIIV